MLKLKNFILSIFICLGSISYAELDSLDFSARNHELIDGKDKKNKTKKRKSNPSGLKKMKIALKKNLFQKAIKRKTSKTIKHKKQGKKRKFNSHGNKYQKKSFKSSKTRKNKGIKRKNIWNDNR